MIIKVKLWLKPERPGLACAPRLKPWVNSFACEKPVEKGIPAIKVLLQGFSSRERGVTFKAMVSSFLRDTDQ
jgi:hypothetical protein